MKDNNKKPKTIELNCQEHELSSTNQKTKKNTEQNTTTIASKANDFTRSVKAYEKWNHLKRIIPLKKSECAAVTMANL